MSKEHRGREPKTGLKKAIINLRDKENMSFVEIAEELDLNSRQLAKYHYDNPKNRDVDN